MTAPAAETAAVTAPVAAAGSARAVQLIIRAQLLRDVTKIWPLLDRKRLSETFPGWLQAMSLLLRSYHSQSSVAAGERYRVLRRDHTASRAPRSLIRVAPLPPQEWLDKALGFSGPGMLTKDTAQPGTALSTTLGTASRIVLDGARTTTIDTVRHDPVAVGWYRVTDGNPCAFCALLASRGVVYKADTVNFQAHNDCGCTSAPAFSRDAGRLPKVNRDAAALYKESTRGVRSGQQLAAFRKAWAEHQRSPA